ncbi:MAG: efflux RND transporter permease subunit [Pseudomonadota bacterium]
MAQALTRSFTDLFIRRPVLATVVSLIILIVGGQAALNLSVRQFPELTKTTITVSTSYPGADAELMQGFITTPIQQAVASTEGVDIITSSSRFQTSLVTLELRLNADGDKALTDVLTKLNQVRNILPREANDPVVTKSTGEDFALMYIDYRSDVMTPSQITEYLTRVVQPALQTIKDVGRAQILGAKTFSMRLWLDPQRMAALGITASDINAAIRDNNFISAAGRIKGDFIQIPVKAETDLKSVEAFADLVIAERGGTMIRMRDIGEVELASRTADFGSYSSGKKAIFLAIYPTPGANPLEVSDRVRAAYPAIKANFPPGLESDLSYDASDYIREAIREVLATILEAALIVIVVIFLFLGSVRATIIPIVTIPLSLVGVMVLLAALGYSINLLTLLALVLAIGLVVDDAIVVLENIHRHVEAGMEPIDAALVGAREITLPVIAMTITLAAVYAPIGFLGGLTGALFREFAFTLAGAVVVSGVIALTLSPMMASRLIRPEETRSGRLRQAMHAVDRLIGRWRRAYERRLAKVLEVRPAMFILALGLILASVFMFMTAKRELAPTEDGGVAFMVIEGPATANLDYMEHYVEMLAPIYASFPESFGYFLVIGRGDAGNTNSGFAGMLLKPWAERARKVDAILPELQAKLATVPGIQVFAFNMPSLPGSSGGPPVQFVVKTTADYPSLLAVMDRLRQAANESGMFIFTNVDLRFDTPQLRVAIDHAKANQLGVKMADIGTALSTMLGGNFVNRFAVEGRSYEVIPQAPRAFRLSPDWLARYQVRTASGAMVPLSTVVSLRQEVEPNALAQFQQLNAATLSAAPFPGRTQGEALAFLAAKAREILPEGYSTDVQGESRQYVQEGASLAVTFGFALVIIFLVLAAQFESWRDPIIILMTVPLSIFGALLPVTFGLASLNIYTQVGLVTLIGLISKHGILMVEFANRLQQREGLNRRQAIVRAAGVRLRPILMTTAAMVMGVVPLLLATGAGAASRLHIGIVIAAGMTIGTLFTLYVVPAVYSILGERHFERHRRQAAAPGLALHSE